MKALVFDTGPIITLAMNNLLWLVKEMKDKFNGEFYITESVKRECVDRPLTSKKYKYEAIQVFKLIQDGIIKIYKNPELKHKSLTLLNLANSLFKAHDNYIKNVQYAEIEAIMALKLLGAEAVVIDEFITRSLIEDPLSVKKRMKKKLHTNVMIDDNNLKLFKKEVKGVKVIRSFELVTIAYELGMFENYYLKLPDPKKTLLDGLLWGVKLNGCSVTEHEIREVMKIYIR